MPPSKRSSKVECGSYEDFLCTYLPRLNRERDEADAEHPATRVGAGLASDHLERIKASIARFGPLKSK